MKKKILLLLLTFTVSVVLAACSGEKTSGTQSSESVQEAQAKEEVVIEEPTEVTIADEFGDITIPLSPGKVVVLDMNTLETLDKMGVNVAGVPQANLPKHLSKYSGANYENVGSLFELDFEKIAEINPDLIIISGRQRSHHEELSKIAPTYLMNVDFTNYLDSFKNNMKTLGQIFNQEDFIESELVAIEDAIEALKTKVPTDKKGLVVLANQGNINAYGIGSRFGIIHDTFGVTPADEKIEIAQHGMNVSFEYIVDKDPDYLFVIDRDLVTTGEPAAQKTIENELVKNTKAYRDGKIFYLDPAYWYIAGGGLISFNEMVKSIQEAIE